MKTITLSGGNYGGTTVDVGEVDEEYTVVDANGVTWVYRIDGLQGIFNGCR
jgi:hypothetical protein